MPELTHTCAKCQRRLPYPEFAPAYCAKCDLVNALLVERYTIHERAPEPDNPPLPSPGPGAGHG